jgi:hypothetical protein
LMIERMVHQVGEAGWVGALVRGASPDRVSVVQGRSDAGARSSLPSGTIVVEVAVGDMSGRTVVHVRVSSHDQRPDPGRRPGV